MWWGYALFLNKSNCKWPEVKKFRFVLIVLLDIYLILLVSWLMLCIALMQTFDVIVCEFFFVVQLNSNSVSFALFGYVKWWNVNRKKKKKIKNTDELLWHHSVTQRKKISQSSEKEIKSRKWKSDRTWNIIFLLFLLFQNKDYQKVLTLFQYESSPNIHK